MDTTATRDFRDILKIVDDIGSKVIADTAPDVDRQARFPAESFAAIKEQRLLSCYVPREFGGDELSISQVCKICETLGRYCASTAMVFAMHQIQVACLVHHARVSNFFRDYLVSLSNNQYLLASATTELGIGGDLRSSLCAIDTRGETFTLTKQAPVISYALDADAILVTCRSHPDAAKSDQVHVLVNAEDSEFEPLSGWDTLGFRGTCSSGYVLTTKGNSQQVLPEPFADILSKTMHPVSHLVWGSLWLGLATDAVHRARNSVRNAYRKNPDSPAITSIRLSEVDEQLYSMKSGLYMFIREYEDLLKEGNDSYFSNFGFAIRTNNVKLRCSEMVVDIVGRALSIVGISGYRNDSKNSLSRHIRDAYGAALMVNNDRIRQHNATMQVAVKES